jgi:hypothetical protein
MYIYIYNYVYIYMFVGWLVGWFVGLFVCLFVLEGAWSCGVPSKLHVNRGCGFQSHLHHGIGLKYHSEKIIGSQGRNGGNCFHIIPPKSRNYRNCGFNFLGLLILLH